MSVWGREGVRSGRDVWSHSVRALRWRASAGAGLIRPTLVPRRHEAHRKRSERMAGSAVGGANRHSAAGVLT